MSDQYTTIKEAFEKLKESEPNKWMLISPNGMLYSAEPDKLITVLLPETSMSKLMDMNKPDMLDGLVPLIDLEKRE